MFELSFYSGHNSSFTIAEDGKILEVLDIERLIEIKNMGLAWFEPRFIHPAHGYKTVLNYFKKKYGVTKFDTVLCNYSDLKAFSNEFDSIYEFFNTKKVIPFWHQEGHAYNSFYQSPFDEAHVLSFDGGGDDGNYNYYKIDRKNGLTLLNKDGRSNIGEKYAYLGYHCDSIKQEQLPLQGMLVYPGKLMGLVGYGQVVEEYKDAIRNYYVGHHWNSEMRLDNYKKLQDALKLPVGDYKLNGQIEKDIVATSQFVFEEVFDKSLYENISDKESNLVLTGGCAMNILNNTRVAKTRPTFVSPNPDDRGLSLGFMLGHLKPEEPFDSTYIGPEPFDKETLSKYVHQYNAKPLRLRHLADELFLNHKIIGVVRGTMEHGARALGNRSILCHPSAPNMKDTLNAKVKNREYYRPFAPVVRLEDVNKYFEWEGETRWMSFCPRVRTAWRDRLKAITHVDGTARVQTVTREQNEWLYDLLTVIAYHYEVGVLLNTSFNIAGKPILNTYRDAIWMLENTQMDGVFLEDFYFSKGK